MHASAWTRARPHRPAQARAYGHSQVHACTRTGACAQLRTDTNTHACTRSKECTKWAHARPRNTRANAVRRKRSTRANAACALTQHAR
eukprot:6212992-Pleurochrysis_carterae.AAC.1